MDNKEEGKTGLVGDIPIFFDPKNEFHYQKLKSAREKEVEKLVDRMCISCQHLGSDHWHGYGACVYCACTEYEHKDPLKKLEEERGKIYGDPFLSHQAIGLSWEGIFRNRYHGFVLQQNPVAIGPNDLGVGQLFPRRPRCNNVSRI